MQTNPTPDALVERVARAVAEAWRNDALPSERYSPEEVNWQDWLPEARAALDATPLAAMQERIERLEKALADIRDCPRPSFMHAFNREARMDRIARAALGGVSELSRPDLGDA